MPRKAKTGLRAVVCIVACSVGVTACDDDTRNTTSNDRPSAYPAAFDVIYKPARPLPADYAFGRTTTTLAAGTTYPPSQLPLPCAITHDRDIPVTLRDGTVIYTDVLRPANNTAKLPAIVAWSPYGKALPTAPLPSVDPAVFSGIAKAEGPDAAFWACRGYAIVNPDGRGAYQSGGNIPFWGSVDANDGYDVIEWAAAQDWSNGKVGLHGTSWLSISQWFIAATRPPHLAAIAPWNGFSDFYRNNLALGGIPNGVFNDFIESMFVGKNQFESASAMIAKYPLLNDYWRDKAAKLERITVPAYVTADGVTTLHRTGALDGFRRIASTEKWLRVNDTNEWTDQYTPAREQDLSLFFDHYLKNVDNGWQNTPKVRISVLDPGGTDLVDVPYGSWPVAGTDYRPLYLNAGDGSMSTAPVASAATASYAATTSQTSFSMTFTQDTQITGYLKARLYVEAVGADDMDLFVLVEKLAADGTVLVASPAAAAAYVPIPPPGTPGRLRVSLRELDSTLSSDYEPVGSYVNPQKLSAGQIVAVDIALMPEAMVWHAGEQIRLTVAGQAIKEALPTVTLNAGTHVIHTGGAYPSFLQLPVVPVAR